MVKLVAWMCLDRWDVVVLLCVTVQAYVDGVNSKIFFFFLALLGLNVYCCFCNFTESILTAFWGLFYSFERNSTTQRHYSLSNSCRVNRFNNFGSDIQNYTNLLKIFCSDLPSIAKILNSTLINVSNFWSIVKPQNLTITCVH